MDVGNSLAVSFLLRSSLPPVFLSIAKWIFLFPFSFSLTAIFLLCKETVFALTASLLKTEKENRSVFQRPVRRIRKHFAIHSVQRQSIMQWCYVARHISIPDISPSNPFWRSQLFLLWAERTQSWVVKQIWRRGFDFWGGGGCISAENRTKKKTGNNKIKKGAPFVFKRSNKTKMYSKHENRQK